MLRRVCHPNIVALRGLLAPPSGEEWSDGACGGRGGSVQQARARSAVRSSAKWWKAAQGRGRELQHSHAQALRTITHKWWQSMARV